MHLLLCIALILSTILFFAFLLIYFFLMDEPSIKVFYRTIGRDVRSIVFLSRIYFLLQYCRFRNLTFIDFFNHTVIRYRNSVCIVFEDEEWTFKQVDDFSNKIANFFLEQGYQNGDEVALLMENCPEYVCFWIGLAKIGVVTALVNTNLKKESLAHILNSLDMKALIFGQNFVETLENTMPYLRKSNSIKLWCFSRKSQTSNSSFPCTNLNTLLETVHTRPLDAKVFKADFKGKLLYIYTSGTTGLPKAAIITHRRFLFCAKGVDCLTSPYKPRVLFMYLPLYHAAAGVFLAGAILSFGGKMVMKKKFSASNFWKDILKHKVSIAVYIGEICRYLLNQPKVAEETQHSLQLMIGYGLTSPELWNEFQERFGVKNIIEGYSSTEGNISLCNYYGKAGSAGVIYRNFQKLQGVFLIQVNPATGEIVRDTNGLCVRCKPGEPGEIVGQISSMPFSKFDGYINKAESNKKIIRNCWKKGDKVFASGDILVMDEDGFVFFKDRFGDTFRWKGENVSTTEVENILSKALDFASCIVYGVEIPGHEGRAGMAAIEIDDLNKIDFGRLYKYLSENLPTYATPAFIRISKILETTGTFKLKKSRFQEQGYNPEIIEDPLYVIDPKKMSYTPLTSEIYCDVLNGAIRF